MAQLTRRSFLSGLLATTPIGLTTATAHATSARALSIVTRTLEVNGRAASVYGLEVDGKPGGMTALLGESFRVRLTNSLDKPSLIHWHGLTPPSPQDGVPGLSQPLLEPGAAYDYDFPLTRAGTHWMHSHVGLQEQQLLAAPLIVRETAEPVFDEQEHVVMLHDFTFRDPEEILAELRSGGGAHAGHAMDHSTMDHDTVDMGGGAMDTGPAMLNDVVFDAYLANDRTLDDPETVTVEKGGWLRLRIINGAAASNMWIHLGVLTGELVAVDGHAVHPVRGSLFPLAIAQRADIRLRIPLEGGSFPVLFRPEGVGQRAGIILATAGAAIAREDRDGEVTPALDLSFERGLVAVAELPDEPITRTEMLMLTGGGADYSWGLNGKPSMHDTLFTVRPGERVAVMMHNMTTMSHPMHLHGHYFQVMAIGNQRLKGAVRDTILVPPMETVTIAFDANNPGSWAFHCHHLYHMNAGMMGAMAYTGAA
ncbi:MAG: multicopper oxidase family protein [Alphaproteobacteria bacterium]|nr:multicopper oxidase family protein [Alphaproteobacteria bacterium]